MKFKTFNKVVFLFLALTMVFVSLGANVVALNNTAGETTEELQPIMTSPSPPCPHNNKQWVYDKEGTCDALLKTGGLCPSRVEIYKYQCQDCKLNFDFKKVGCLNINNHA